MLDLGPVYLDLSVLSAAPPPATVLREPTVPYIGAPYGVGVADDLEWASLGRLRDVWEVLGTFAARWSARADANEAALAHLPTGAGRVRVLLEGEVAVEQDAARLGLVLAHAALAFREAASQARERHRAVEALLAREAMGPHWRPRAPHAEPPTPERPVPPPTEQDRERCEIVLSLRDRRFHTATQYAAAIGARCVGPRGEGLGRSAVLGWLRRRGLYHGRGTDVDRMKVAAEAYAERVVGEGRRPAEP